MNAQEVLILSFRILSLGLVVQSLELINSTQLWQNNGAFRKGLPEKYFKCLLYVRLLIVLASFIQNLLVPAIIILWLINWIIFHKFQGALTGGSDSMINISLTSILIGQVPSFTKFTIIFIAIQSLASYFIAGLVKLRQKDWRTGGCLQLFLEHTVYKNPIWLEKMTSKKRLLKMLSWMLILAEVTLPVLIFAYPHLCSLFLGLGIIFHLTNAYWFGINRFVYAWLATYPCIWYLVNNFI